MRRDLRHLGWVMAVLIPVAVVLTLLTSADVRQLSRLAAPAPTRVLVARLVRERPDEGRETRRVERREMA